MPSYFSELEDMKGMGGTFLRKFKLIPTITNLKQGLVLQLNPPGNVFCIKKCPTPPIHDDDNKESSLAELEFNAIEDEKYFEEEEFSLSNLSNENLAAPNLSETMMGPNSKQVACTKEHPSLTDFEEICPPGSGSNSIILYTTSLRGIRKTFQDCSTIRFLLRSFKVMYHERDVSLHLEYREELWKIFGGKVIPPKLFIKGRYIGGADEVVGLHEMGWLGKLMEGTEIDSAESSCIGCANIRFAICSACCGSCKVFTNNGDNSDQLFLRCAECNENGLVKCPICC